MGAQRFLPALGLKVPMEVGHRSLGSRQQSNTVDRNVALISLFFLLSLLKPHLKNCSFDSTAAPAPHLAYPGVPGRTCQGRVSGTRHCGSLVLAGARYTSLVLAGAAWPGLVQFVVRTNSILAGRTNSLCAIQFL
eukprot:gene16992-23267_t